MRRDWHSRALRCALRGGTPRHTVQVGDWALFLKRKRDSSADVVFQAFDVRGAAAPDGADVPPQNSGALNHFLANAGKHAASKCG